MSWIAVRVRDGIRRTAHLEHRIGWLDACRQCGGQKEQHVFRGLTLPYHRRDFEDAYLDGRTLLRLGYGGIVGCSMPQPVFLRSKL